MDLITVMDPYEMPLSENRTFYSIQSPRKSPPPPPPPSPARRRLCHAIRQRNNVELQRKNSRRNIAFSVSTILPLKSSIYKDHKSLSLQQESQKL